MDQIISRVALLQRIFKAKYITLKIRENYLCMYIRSLKRIREAFFIGSFYNENGAVSPNQMTGSLCSITYSNIKLKV